MVHLEPKFHSLLVREMSKTGKSASTYMRGLLLKDLADKGLIQTNDLLEVMGAR